MERYFTKCTNCGLRHESEESDKQEGRCSRCGGTYILYKFVTVDTFNNMSTEIGNRMEEEFNKLFK